MALLVWAGAGSAAADEIPRSPAVANVRTGHHAEFDRIVLVLDRAAVVRWQAPSAPGDIAIWVGARPANALQILGGLAGGPVELRRSDDATELRASWTGPVRVFTLETPPRVVIDLGAPGSEPFYAPPGTVAIAPEAETPEVAPPEPVAVEDPVEEPTSEAPPPVTLAPQLEPEQPELPVEELARVEPPPAPKPPTPVTPVPATPPPVGPDPEVAQGERGSSLRSFGPLVLVGLAVLVLGGLALYARRSRNQPAPAPALQPPDDPEVITPEELGPPAGRVEVLEKRLDDEVRRRMQVEERVGKLLEEQKVLRDRLQRVSRRPRSETG